MGEGHLEGPGTPTSVLKELPIPSRCLGVVHAKRTSASRGPLLRAETWAQTQCGAQGAGETSLMGEVG